MEKDRDYSAENGPNRYDIAPNTLILSFMGDVAAGNITGFWFVSYAPHFVCLRGFFSWVYAAPLNENGIQIPEPFIKFEIYIVITCIE